ncbi:MAG: methyltransferase domain-containing protein [Pseudobacteriovorax sp.]|nr:methyltransferase domain-containing protein [Pseudobacteriovorax sp.]
MEVGNNIKSERGSWTFGGDVANTFVDHVRNSVPLYEEGHDLVCQISDFFCQNDSTAYEIGVSTGELLNKLATHQKHKPKIKWIGIDTEENMIEKAKEHCSSHQNIKLIKDDIRLHDFRKNDFIVSYYCLQFVPERHRQEVVNKLYDSLNWGGALVLFEKVRGPDARFQDIVTSLYNDFKENNGFTSDEILQKTRSLKSVMSPFSVQGNLDMLERAGFKDVTSVMKYICFEGFLAIK